MQKSKSRENISTSAEASSDKNSTSSKTLPSPDFSGLMTDLNTLNSEGNSLMKQSKLEEANAKFIQGHEKFELAADKIYSLYTNNEKVDQILALYKILLSKIAECFYEQKKYKEAIEFDLKLICLEPKNSEAIYRLFNSYSKIEKSQQAVYYGDVYLELESNNKNKFENAKEEIEKEKIKLFQIQNSGKSRIKIILFNFIFMIVIVLLMKLFFNMNKNN
jgi:tetratricopeptide (TPR) repeat protein